MLFTAEEDRRQFEVMLQLARVESAPKGLAFWLRSTARSSATIAWAECPRADWMLWIAKRVGVSSRVIGRVENYVAEQHERRRQQDHLEFRPLITAAQSVRETLSWHDVWSSHAGTR